MTGPALVVFSLLSPGIYFLLHGVLSRSLRNRSLTPQKIAVLTCLAGACLQLNLLLVGLGISFESAAFGFFTSFCTAHVYFHCFNMSETARRIRVLVAHHLGRLEARVDADSTQKAAVRLRRLRELGTVVLRGNRYYVRPGILPLASRLLVAYEGWIFPERFKRQE